MRRVLYVLGLLVDEDVDWLVNVGKKQKVSPDEVLIREGGTVEAIYLVVSGRFSVIAGQGNRLLAILGPGEVLGEISLLDSRPPTATVRADVTSIVLRVPRPTLLARLESDDAFAARFYKALAQFLGQRLRQTVASFGYAKGHGLDEDAEAEDEIDPELLESISLAGARFNWLVERMRGD